MTHKGENHSVKLQKDYFCNGTLISMADAGPSLFLTERSTTNNPTDPTTYTGVGQVITFTYTVTNDGDVDIAGPISVSDNVNGEFTVSDTELAPGQSVTKGKSYLITPQDIENGFVVNSAFATGSFNDKKVTSDTDKAIAKFFRPTTNLFSS
jgi:uncharacterized repeat protein (TIGR01451 family)